MKILFTGGSSFSGMWFIKELAEAGHEVTACFRNALENYTGLRKKRVEAILPLCRPIFSASFGSETFLQALASSAWDLFCHHAADVTDYKSPDFNVAAAVTSNTFQLKKVLQNLQDKGCNRVLLTGSVFEQNEGAGSDNLRAVSPYGLSKGLTSEIFHYYTFLLGMKLCKFVIPNPFGPFEEPRYTTYLAKTWFEGTSARVQTPEYVRDNVPISLLAKAYRSYAEGTPSGAKFNPSCYVESQGAFTARVAKELRERLKLPCHFELQQQTSFSEPKVRINTDLLSLPWNERQAWDELAHYYQSEFAL